MGKEENGFLKKLQKAFKIESEERLESLAAGLVELEKAPRAEKYPEIAETIFREAHSLKGAARSASLWDIERIFQALENVFGALKHREIDLKPELFDLLHRTLDTVKDLLAPDNPRGPNPGKYQRVTKLVEELGSYAPGKFWSVTQAGELETGTPEEAVPDTAEPLGRKPQFQQEYTTSTPIVRVPAEKLDSLMLQAEDMLQVKLLAMRNRDDIAELLNMIDLWKKDRSQLQQGMLAVQRSLKTEEERANLKELIELDMRHAKFFEEKLLVVAKSAEHDQRSIGGMVDTLLDDMKDVLMLPFSSFLEIAPKIIRDLSKDQEKEVQVSLKGGEIEIDKRILDEMKDPIIHLLRNCIDHGIEKPEVRKRSKKPETGTISIFISQVNGNRVQMSISDDGAGIDIKKLKKAAIKHGVLAKEKADEIDEREAMDFIFLSEITTSPIVTDVSGRGLGLAIVKEKVEKLGGTISVESRPKLGTTLRILLPITLATFRGILARAAEQLFIMPTEKVERVTRVHPNDIKTVENKETIPLSGQTVSLVRLDDVLELPRREKGADQSELVSVMVLGAEDKRIAFMVDQVLDEEEVLFKSLGKQLSRVRNVYGTTVLGTGKIVPILNAEDLMLSAVHVEPVAGKPAIPSREAGEKKLSVLVVEDSVTSRMFLKKILESAGYQVKTSADGLEAFTELKEGDYELVVSDIDMPRMNGFVLTSKIREDKKLAELPVVLVTALETREDRERGIEVGANAYIAKSSFDQSNLLEVVQRLI